MANPTSKSRPKKERKVKTVTPVAVMDISELDKVLNCISMLMNMENLTPQGRVNVKANARSLQGELRNYRRRATEYYKLAD